MKMQPGDYIHKADIPDKATHNRIRGAVRAMGHIVLNGAGEWHRRNGPKHEVITLTDGGNLVWRSTGDCDGRRLTPADILDAGEQPNIRPARPGLCVGTPLGGEKGPTTHAGYNAPAHPHPAAELLADIAAEARVNPEPWTAYEHRTLNSGWITPSDLTDLLDSAARCVEVRRKPRTITINGHEVPEPCREPLENRQKYYVPAPGLTDGVLCQRWHNEAQHYRRLRAGLVHLTPEAAKAHSDALVSFTRWED